MKSHTKNGNQRWSKSQEHHLVELHDVHKKSWASLAREFGRSRQAVLRKYWALKNGYVPTRRRPETAPDREASHWTPREDELLRHMSKHRHGISFMSRHLKRSVKAIATRMALLVKQDRHRQTPGLFDTLPTGPAEIDAKQTLLKLRNQLGNEALLKLLNS